LHWQGSFLYALKHCDIMRSTYDSGAMAPGRCAVFEISIRKKTASGDKLLFNVAVGEQVRLAACPKELFVIRHIGVYTDAKPRSFPSFKSFEFHVTLTGRF